MLLLTREFMTAALFSLSVCMLAWISVYLLRMREMYGRGWTQVPGAAAACVLLWVFFSDGVRDGFTWFALMMRNRGIHGVFHNDIVNIILIFSNLVGVVVLVRGIQIFSRDEMGQRGWLSAVAVTMVFLAYSVWRFHVN